jgi:hypothetical protein
MSERWFVFRILVDDERIPEPEGMQDENDPKNLMVEDALSAAENAANEVSPEGVKFKIGPEIVSYREGE